MSVFKNIILEHINKNKEQMELEYRANCQTIYNNCYTSVVSTFKWGNLPKSTLHFLPERFLYYYGIMGAFMENGEFRILPATPSGTLLENGEYSQYILYTLNGKTYIKDREDLVLCYNNSRALPSYIFVSELSEKMSYALSAVDITLEKAMLPDIVECRDQNQLNMITGMLDKRNNLKAFATTMSAAISKNEISVHKMFDNRERDILSLWDIYIRYRNLFYTTFGINNVEIQKKERLTEAEGSGNDEISRYTLINDMYENRKVFVEKIKEKFNYELSIEINRNSSTVFELNSDNQEKIDNIIIEKTKGANVELMRGGEENENSETDRNNE